MMNCLCRSNSNSSNNSNVSNGSEILVVDDGSQDTLPPAYYVPFTHTEPVHSHFTLPEPADAMILQIDEEDKDDPQQTYEYIHEIYGYMRSLEVTFQLPFAYLCEEDYFTRNRNALVGWLVCLHSGLDLMQETLFLGVSLLDRYLAFYNDLQKEQLNLLAITCLFIASKYEDRYPLMISQALSCLSTAGGGNIYIRKNVLDMEVNVLQKLQHRLGQPLMLHFLRRGTKAARGDWLSHGISKFLLEVALMEPLLVGVSPSLVAMAALMIGKLISCGEWIWSPTMEYYTGYTFEDIIPFVNILIIAAHKCYTRANDPKAKNNYESLFIAKWSKPFFLGIAKNELLIKYLGIPHTVAVHTI